MNSESKLNVPANFVETLHRYPLKSARGEQINVASILSSGIKGDRQWMLVDETGGFITQRKYPLMGKIHSRFENAELLLKIPFEEEINISNSQAFGWKNVVVWGDEVKALQHSDEIAAKLSRFLKIKVQLVEMSEAEPRLINDEATEGIVSFADAFPFLLIGSASLTHLNDRLGEQLIEPITMQRFRPNIVVKTNKAHEEDNWDEVKIGEVIFKNVKLCSRCILTTIDPETATFSKTKEPLVSLNKYRNFNKGIMFGVNLIAQNEGVISQQDKVEVLSYR